MNLSEFLSESQKRCEDAKECVSQKTIRFHSDPFGLTEDRADFLNIPRPEYELYLSASTDLPLALKIIEEAYKMQPAMMEHIYAKLTR